MSEDQLTHWNHRIVRRYAPDGLDYLAITEVYYAGNKPKTFVIDPSAPFVALADFETDEERIASLREALDQMRLALDKPILDERVDFKDEIEAEDRDGLQTRLGQSPRSATKPLE